MRKLLLFATLLMLLSIAHVNALEVIMNDSGVHYTGYMNLTTLTPVPNGLCNIQEVGNITFISDFNPSTKHIMNSTNCGTNMGIADFQNWSLTQFTSINKSTSRIGYRIETVQNPIQTKMWCLNKTSNAYITINEFANPNGALINSVPAECLTGDVLQTAYGRSGGANNNVSYIDSNVSFYVAYLENSVTFSNVTSVGASETFSINITYDTSFTSATAILNYNGTNYSTTESSTGFFTRTLTIPQITGQKQNNTLFWYISLANSTQSSTYTSRSYNQTVNALGIDDCTSFPVRIYNFTMFDEDNLQKIHPTNFNTTIETTMVFYSSLTSSSPVANFSANWTRINPASVCLRDGILNFSTYYVDVQTRYDADNYVSEFYNEQRTLISNQTTPRHIELYDLLTSRSQEFTLFFKDASLLPLTDYLVQVNRKYLSDGSYRTVEIGKTDNDGKTLLHFVLSDIYYRMTLTKNGDVIYVYPDFQASCQDIVTGECEVTKYIYTDAPTSIDFTLIDGVELSPMTYNETTRVLQTSFTVADGTSKLMILNVTDGTGRQISSTSLTSSSGTLSLTVPQLTLGLGQSNLTLIASVSKQGKILARGFIDLNEDPDDLFGRSRVIIIVGIILSLVMMTVSSGVLMIVMFILALILSSSLSLLTTFESGTVSLGGAIAGFIITFIVALVKYSRSQQDGN